MSDNCCNLDFTIDESLNIPMAISGANYNEPYELPTMSSGVKGGAYLGDGLEVDESERLNIEDGGVTTDKLGDGSVTTDKLADGAVTADKFSDDVARGLGIVDKLNMNKIGILPYQRTADGYPHMQGGCLGESGYFIQYQIKGNTDENRLGVFSIDTGDTIRQTTGYFGHGNSVEYHDGKIYITGGASDQYSSSIHIIDYETLNVIETISNTSFYGLKYMDSINAWVAMNTVWGEVYNTSQKLYILNDDFTVRTEADFSNFNVGKTSAGMGIVGDYICVLTLEPTSVLLFNGNLEFVKSIELNRNIDCMHFASEVEWIDGDLENTYFGVRLFGRANANAGNHLIASSSLLASIAGGSPTLSTVTREFTETIYVGEPTDWQWYENGTQSNPFNNPYLAANAAQIRELERLYVNFKAATTYDFELGFEDCYAKITIRDDGNHEESELVTFTGQLYVQNAEVFSQNIKFGSTVSGFRIVGAHNSKITLLSTRYSSTPIMIDASRYCDLSIGLDETTYNFTGSAIRRPVTFGNRVYATGLMYSSKPTYSFDSNYFKGVQNFTQNVTNNNTGAYTVWLPTGVPTPWIAITLNGTSGGSYSGKSAYCELDVGQLTASGTPVYFPDNPNLVGGVAASSASGGDANWAGVKLTLKVFDTSNNNADVTNQWILKYIRLNG